MASVDVAVSADEYGVFCISWALNNKIDRMRKTEGILTCLEVDGVGAVMVV